MTDARHRRVVGRKLGRPWGCAGLFVALAAACGANDDEATSDALGRGSTTTEGDGNGSVGAAGAGAGLPPEQELEASFLAPAVSGTRIFTVNPESGRLAILDSETLEVTLTHVGFTPTLVVALPRAQEQGAQVDHALVLNSGSSDATHVRVDAQGGVTTQRIPTHVGANSIHVSAEGQWAVVWTDYRRVSVLDATDGFQDITVINLVTDSPTRLTVGFRPVVIALSGDRERGYVTTEPGVDVLDLSGARPAVTHSIGFAGGAASAPASADMSYTADLRYAFLRFQALPQLAVLDLQNESWSTLPMSGVVTDLDLSQDGTVAAAVVRDPIPQVLVAPVYDGGVTISDAGVGAAPPDAGSALDAGMTDAAAGGQVVDAALTAPDGSLLPPAPAPDPAPTADGGVAPVPPETGSQVVLFRLDAQAALADPRMTRVPDELFGSVSIATDGSVLTLFTNAQESDRITILDVETLEHRTVEVKSPVLAIVVAEDGEHAVSLQAPAMDAPSNSTKKGAFSLFPLKVERAPKIVATDAAPVSLALMPGSPSFAGLVTVSDPATRNFATYRVGFPSLTADAVRLASEPLATGVIGAAQLGFVAQSHPQGRLTLIDLQSGAPRTLTGFELAAEVVE